MILRGFLLRVRSRLHNEEAGFTIVESMVAGMVLAVGAFAVANSLSYGLDATGLARQRLAAQTTAEQQMELARSLNYESVVLDSGPISKSSNPDNPDFWVSTDGLEYDPTETGSASAYEELILEPGANPALTHFQDPVIQGNTKFRIFVYVTWVDSPADGTDGSDEADGNGDGVSDANGQDAKRVTTVVQWPNPFGAPQSQLKMSTIISDGKVPFKDPNASGDQPPSVSCPVVTTNGLDASFEAQGVFDPDGGTVEIDWDFGDGATVADGGISQSHTYAAAGDYDAVITVTDDEGNPPVSSSGCSPVSVTTGGSGGPGSGPSGTVVISGNAAFTTEELVTLTLTSSASPASIQVSDDNINWGLLQPYGTQVQHTLPAGEGLKTVYVRFLNSAGDWGAIAQDQIVLDLGPPPAPTSLNGTRGSGPDKDKATLTWAAPVPSTDVSGYQIWRRATPAGAWSQVSCTFSGLTTCEMSGLSPPTNYEVYVLSVDAAGNVSGQSNHVFV